jgi:hypothetical protein
MHHYYENLKSFLNIYSMQSPINYIESQPENSKEVPPHFSSKKKKKKVPHSSVVPQLPSLYRLFAISKPLLSFIRHICVSKQQTGVSFSGSYPLLRCIEQRNISLIKSYHDSNQYRFQNNLTIYVLHYMIMHSKELVSRRRFLHNVLFIYSNTLQHSVYQIPLLLGDIKSLSKIQKCPIESRGMLKSLVSPIICVTRIFLLILSIRYVFFTDARQIWCECISNTSRGISYYFINFDW